MLCFNEAVSEPASLSSYVASGFHCVVWGKLSDFSKTLSLAKWGTLGCLCQRCVQGFGEIHGKLPCLWRALKRVLAIIMGVTTAAVGFLCWFWLLFLLLYPLAPACPTTLFPVSFSHSMQPRAKILVPCANWKVLCLLIVALAVRRPSNHLEGML